MSETKSFYRQPGGDEIGNEQRTRLVWFRIEPSIISDTARFCFTGRTFYRPSLDGVTPHKRAWVWDSAVHMSL
jgi:hypothetical protein